MVGSEDSSVEAVVRGRAPDLEEKPAPRHVGASRVECSDAGRASRARRRADPWHGCAGEDRLEVLEHRPDRRRDPDGVRDEIKDRYERRLLEIFA